MRHLVTGCAGFIGSHLCELLLGDGHAVVGVDDLSAGSPQNVAHLPELEWVEGDIREAELMQRLAVGCDTIFHQAAIGSVPRSMTLPALYNDVNVGGTMNVLNAARDVGCKVVLASSSSIYGIQERYPVREEFDPGPRSPYAATKLSCEVYCQTWQRAFGVFTICLRYFNVYGPRQNPESQYAAVVPRFVRAALEGQRPTIFGDGEQARDFTFVGDVTRANLLASRAPESAAGQVFNIGGGRTPTSVNQIWERIAALAGSDAEPIYEDARPGDVRLSSADISKAGRVLGFEAAVSIDDGLKTTVEWTKAQRA